MYLLIFKKGNYLYRLHFYHLVWIEGFVVVLIPYI